ncbi:peptidoglycan DD-metalloendopeptidase family protein [bacterium]|nr:peptidoglycan DD-metalloendopeptidase family protein [bacterium]
MSKVKYRYNPQTLSYDKIELKLVDKLKRLSFFFSASLLMGVIIYGVFYNYVDSPKEKILQREKAYLQSQYTLLNKKLDQFSAVLDDVQKRDDNIYRVIFEAEPIGNEIRKAGFGGINRYKEIEGYDNSQLVISSNERIDQLSKQLYIQSKSFDDVFKTAKKKEDMLACLPAIQPVQNRDLKRMASGFGMARMHPILKYVRPHKGMDFSAKTGTPIYATGDGEIIQADSKAGGYGEHIRIDHGYGYVTLYAHLSKYNVKLGHKVKRGDVIGYVGNTGISSGPHCHYEVRKNGEHVNPVNYYFNDLTVEEYAIMLEMANAPNQSMD